MIELINIVFKGEHYTLVDEYNDIIENEIVYHFATETDDLFCIKVNDEYREITDETMINTIKKMYDLFPPEVIFNNREKKDTSILPKILFGLKNWRQLDDEKREEFYDIQIEKLKTLDIDIDLSKLKDRLMNKGNVYMCDDVSEESFYHPATDSIFLYGENSFDNKTDLHETIHKAGGPIVAILPHFFVEGGADSIVNKVAKVQRKNRDFSTITSINNYKNQSREIRYNFSLKGSGYFNEVCLLRQIEYAVGYSADKDVLNGTKNILDDFSHQYGKDILIYVNHIAKQVTRNPWRRGSYEKMVKAQNIILERVFNKEFPEELTIENAQEYLNRLQGMELQRAKIEGDEYYKEFYEQKYTTIKQQLLEKGYELSEIKEKIPEYAAAEFYPTLKEAKMREKPISYLAENVVSPHVIARQCMQNEVSSIEQENFKTYVMRRDNLFLEFFTYKGMIWTGTAIKDSKKVFIDALRYTSDEKTEGTSVYYDSESDCLKFDEKGESYEFEEVDVSKEFIEEINLTIQELDELRQNAIQQKDSTIQRTKRNLFQRIKEWMTMKKNNRVQEESQKDAKDER